MPTRPVTDVCSHGLLEQITSPADLRALAPEDLPRVADEIREYLVESIMRLGGHFGSNLGNVELTLALHYVYESPDDAIVWDVSHGCYPHKIITGRREKFSTLRTAGGLSGFLSPAESEHDLATTGHAGTGLSTALGIAWARRYQKNPRPVVAVVGDGSIPSGLSLEALNHVGGHDLSLTIVLNDNQWSIDPTPGALSQVLRDCREGIRRGDFFELLGVRYLGPVDGHDLSLLLELFREAKSRRGPTLIHLVTVKGKGFPEAEEDPYRYHAVSPRSTTGAKGTKGATFSAVFGEALTALARNDPRIVAVCAGMMGGTGLKTFHEEFPDRCFDVGIAEEHAVTFAAGLSLGGLRPVVAIYSTFLQRAYDQIVHDVCIPDLPVVFALDRAGCAGADGPTHHGVFDLAYLRHVPNMKVLAPSNSRSLCRQLEWALSQGSPVAIRYPRGEAPEAEWTSEVTVNPVASRSLREGDAAALLSLGAMVPVALQAAQILASRGMEIEVVEVPCVQPLDEAAIAEIAGRHEYIFTVEDHVTTGGFGSAVAECLSGWKGLRLHRFGWPDQFVEHGAVSELREKHGLDPQSIARSVEKKVRHPDDVRVSALLQVDSEKAARLMNGVRAIQLSDTLEQARTGYGKVGRRDPFLWNWVRRGLELTSLSCVDGDLWDHVCDTKALGVMFDVLLDDVADSSADPEFLEQLIFVTGENGGSPGPPRADKQEYVSFTRSIWNLIWERLERYPRFDEFRDILSFDYDQLINVMRYAALINRQPLVINLVEHDTYLHHNMHMMISGTVDLMASPEFDVRELGALREALWFAQQMGRIGNLVTTWEREIGERDFSSGIFALSLSEGIITVDDLAGDDVEFALEKIRRSHVEGVFLDRWKDHRRRLLERVGSFASVDIRAVVRGLEQLVQLHLSSRGMK